MPSRNGPRTFAWVQAGMEHPGTLIAMEVRVHTDRAAMATLREEWQELFADAESATPFQSWEWVSTWAESFLGSRRVRLIEVRSAGRLVALYPAYLTTGLVRILRPMGLGMSDYLHPLVRTGFEEAWGALREAVPQAGADVADFCQIRESLQACAWGEGIQEAQCLVVSLPPTWDAYTKELGKNLRYKLSKLRRQILEEGVATVRWISPETVDEFLKVLFEVHGQRWRRRGLPGVFMGAKKQAFHRAYLERATRSGHAWLSMLETEGKGVAVVYCLRAGRRVFYYQAGFDPAYGQLSPGTLLLAETARRAIDEGCIELDLMRGDEGYKRNFKPQNCYKNLRVVLPGSRPGAPIASRAIEAQTRLMARLRSRFEGKGLIEGLRGK